MDVAAAHLPEDCWHQQYPLTFAVGLQRAKCAMLIGDRVHRGKNLISLLVQNGDILGVTSVPCQCW
jgi:hypothetical protein